MNTKRIKYLHKCLVLCAVLSAAVIFLFLMATSCSKNQERIVRLEGDEEKKTVQIFAGLSTNDVGIIEMLDFFIKKKLPDLEIEWQSVDWGSGFSKTLQSLISSGEVPDLIIGKAQDVSMCYKIGCIEEIPASVTSKIRSEANQAVTHDGKIYGAVFNGMYQGVLYNKNIFYRYGLDVPRTRAELAAVEDTLKNAGVTPYSAHFQEEWYTANIMMQFAINNVFAANGDWGSEFYGGKRHFSKSQKMQACFYDVRRVYENSYADSLIVPQTEAVNRFIHEDSAMMVTGTWAIQQIKAVAPHMKIGIFPFPNDDGSSKLILEPNLTFMKCRNSENSAEAEKIIELIFSDGDFADMLLSFTQTSSMVHGIAKETSMLQNDLEFYISGNSLVSASLGNSQLLWRFQEKMAKNILLWIQKKITFEELCALCDEDRSESQ